MIKRAVKYGFMAKYVFADRKLVHPAMKFQTEVIERMLLIKTPWVRITKSAFWNITLKYPWRCEADSELTFPRDLAVEMLAFSKKRDRVGCEAKRFFPNSAVSNGSTAKSSAWLSVW